MHVCCVKSIKYEYECRVIYLAFYNISRFRKLAVDVIVNKSVGQLVAVKRHIDTMACHHVRYHGTHPKRPPKSGPLINVDSLHTVSGKSIAPGS